MSQTVTQICLQSGQQLLNKPKTFLKSVLLSEKNCPLQKKITLQKKKYKQ